MSYSNQIRGPRASRLQRVESAKLDRAFRTRLLLVLLTFAYGLGLPACRGSQGTNSNGSASERNVTSATPPFVTREPDRYQATRIITFTESALSGTPSNPRTDRVLIARDGEKRREEYSAGASEQIVYLEIPGGRFILLPASRLYADLSTAADETVPSDRLDGSLSLSPDQLLNEANAPATYEKLGAEMIDGRMTTKYRSTVSDRTGVKDETLIWIDEALGMPVRSETISSTSEGSSRLTMELKDIKLEVDERLFTWPPDYKKVEARLVFDLIRKDGKRAIPNQEEK